MILPKKPLRDLKRMAHPIKAREHFQTLERNERTVDFPPQVLEEIRNLITGFNLRCYPDLDELYQALSQWSGFPREQLLVTLGADGGLKTTWEVFVSEGDEVVTFTPSYAMYPVYNKMFAAKSVELTYNSDLSMPMEKVLNAITPSTRLLAFANPNQPIESMFSLEELRKIADKCTSTNTLLCVDEAYAHFNNTSAADLVSSYSNLVVVRTFSKAFGAAGLRLGYVIAAKELITALMSVKPIYEVNALTAAIGTYLLKNDHLMKDYIKEVNAGRDHLEKFFSEKSCSLHGKYSNTILVGLPQKVRAPDVVSIAREKGFLIRAETNQPIANHLRITIGPVAQMQKLSAALAPHL